VFDAANAEALSLLPATSLVTMIRADRDATEERSPSRQSTNTRPSDQRPSGKRLLVTYQPEAPTGANRRINDVVIRLLPSEKARV